MTVESDFMEKVYYITGVSTIYPWGEPYDTQYGSLVVTEETNAFDRVVVKTYVEGTDYRILDRNVVFFVAPSDTSHCIRITRHTYRGQAVVFNEGEDFPADDFESALDRLAMINQEQDKALQTERYERITTDTTLQENITTEENRAKGVEGSLSNLTTTNKTNLVSAINEVNAEADSLEETISTYGDVVTHNASEFATASQGAKADTAVQPSDLSTVATTGSYDDLNDKPSIPDAQIQSDWSQSDNTKLDYIKNKPSIPSVGNATLTIKQGGATKGTFTANSSTDVVVELDAGGGSSASSLYLTKTVTFAANSSTADIDVSDLVEAGIGYYPVVYFQDADSETLSTRATYIVASKIVRVARDSTATASESYFPTVCLIPTTSTASTVVGITNGQWVDPTYSAHYTKSETDVLLSAKQGTLTFDNSPTESSNNPVTSGGVYTALSGKQGTLTFDSTPTENSTNPVTSGGLYDVIGDVETLINAL